MSRKRLLISSLVSLAVLACSLTALRIVATQASASEFWGASDASARRPTSNRVVVPDNVRRVSAPESLFTAASLSISEDLPAVQGDFVTVPIIFQNAGYTVTNLAFGVHFLTTSLQASLGADQDGVRDVTSVTFPNLPSGFRGQAMVPTGYEGDPWFFLDLDPSTVTNSLLSPGLPDGVVANLKLRTVGLGPTTTPITFEMASPPPFGSVAGGFDLDEALTSDDGSALITPALQSITLLPGTSSNLVGLSIVPSLTTPAALFAPLISTGVFTSVYKYVNCSTWELYTPLLPPFLNTLHAMDEKHGYWVYVATTSTLQITGSIPTYPVTIPLCTGQNLIGHPSKVPLSLPNAISNSIGANWNSVQAYYPLWNPQWKVFGRTLPPFLNTLFQLGPGLGYWLDTTSAVTLSVESGE